MYTNNIIVSACGVVGYFFAGAIVRLLGAKRLLSEEPPTGIFYKKYSTVVYCFSCSLRSFYVWYSWHHTLLVCQQSDDTYSRCSLYHCGLRVLLIPHGNRCRSLSHTVTVIRIVHQVFRSLILIASVLQLYSGSYSHDVRSFGSCLR